MRIAIDAKQYFTGPVSSQTILRNLLPALFLLYPETKWVVFFDAKDRKKKNPFEWAGVEIHYLPTPTNMISNAVLLPAAARNAKADLTLYLMFAPARRLTPSVVFIHDVLFRDFPEYFTWKEKLYFQPLRWLTRHADRIICSTRYVAAKLVEHDYLPNLQKIDVVPLAISSAFRPFGALSMEEWSSVQEELHLPERYVLYVGRLNARKNIHALIKAFSLLRDTSISLVIVGKEDWKPAELTFDDRIKKRICFTGSITDSQLPLVYSKAAIFCFPSFAEGFGLPPLEAMASGVPVVVSDIPALRETLHDAPLYFDPHDPSDLAEKLDHVLESPLVAQKMKQAGLRVAQAYNWDLTAHGVMNAMEKIMG